MALFEYRILGCLNIDRCFYFLTKNHNIKNKAVGGSCRNKIICFDCRERAPADFWYPDSIFRNTLLLPLRFPLPSCCCNFFVPSFGWFRFPLPTTTPPSLIFPNSLVFVGKSNLLESPRVPLVNSYLSCPLIGGQILNSHSHWSTQKNARSDWWIPKYFSSLNEKGRQTPEMFSRPGGSWCRRQPSLSFEHLSLLGPTDRG